MNGINKIIILGSTGFLGKYLLRYFQKNFPNIDVRGYSSAQFDLTEAQDVEDLAIEFDMHTTVIMCSMVKKEFGDNLENYEKNMKWR